VEELMMQEIINAINTVGFPIFVAVFFLIKASKDTQELKKAIEDLTIVVKILAEREGVRKDVG
jgi:hypothetical protein